VCCESARERERGFREEVEGVGDKVMGEILLTRLSVTSVHVFVFVCVEEGGCSNLGFLLQAEHHP